MPGRFPASNVSTSDIPERCGTRSPGERLPDTGRIRQVAPSTHWSSSASQKVGKPAATMSATRLPVSDPLPRRAADTVASGTATRRAIVSESIPSWSVAGRTAPMSLATGR